MIDFCESDMQIVGIDWRIRRQGRGGGGFHEFGIKWAADCNNRKPLFVRQLGERESCVRESVPAKTGNNISDRSGLWLHPKRELQLFARSRDECRACFAASGKLRVVESKKSGFNCFQ